MKIDLRLLLAGLFISIATACCSSNRSSDRDTPSLAPLPPAGDDDEVAEGRRRPPLAPTDARLKAWQAITEADSEAVTLAVGGTSTDSWTNIGPSPQIATWNGVTSPHAGRVDGIAVHPTNNNLWLVAALHGGIWKTTDAGVTWTATTDNQVTLNAESIAFSKSSPNVVYANNGGDGSGGMLQSTDAGSTWQLRATVPFSTGAAMSIRVHPTNSNTLVASTEVAGGVWKSTDGAASFVNTLSGSVNDLDVVPTDFTRQIAGMSGDATGIFLSTTSGDTWSRVGHAATATWEKANRTMGSVKVAIAPSNANVAYVSMEYAEAVDGGTVSGGRHVWKTTNLWANPPTWAEIPNAPSVWHIIVDPTNPSIAYFLEAQLWRLDTTTFTSIEMSDINQFPINQGIHVDMRGAAWAGTRLIIGNDGGVYSTTNPGASPPTWINHNSNTLAPSTRLSIGQFFEGSLHPTNVNVALGGLADNGIVKWTGSSDWREVTGADGFDNMFSLTNPDTTYSFSVQDWLIIRTINDGASSQSAVIEVGKDKDTRPFLTKYVQCPSNGDVVITATDNIYLATDFFTSGATDINVQPNWITNSPDTLGGTDNDLIYSLAFAPSDTACNTYAFGGTNGRLFITKNRGGAWTNLDPSNQVPNNVAQFPLPTIRRLAFDPQNANVLYAALGGFGASGHLFKTTNALSASPTWTNVTPSPGGDVPINAVVVDPFNSNLLYIGTDLGVWRSTDAGATQANWTHYNLAQHGFPLVLVSDLEYKKATDRLVAFTFGRGAYLFQPAIPAAPTLSGTGGTQQASLSWTPTIGARTYNLKRSTTAGGPYSVVKNQAATSFTDTNLAAGTYFYVVTAVNTTGESVNSNEVSVSVTAGIALSPTADAYVRDGTNAGANFGTATTLNVKTNATAGLNRDTYFKFDTSTATSVASAKLQFSATSSEGTAITIAAFAVATTTWTETGITWNNKPALGAQIASVVVNGTPLTVYQIDVTSYVQSEKAAGRNVISLGLHSPTATSTLATLNSKEASSGQPKLVITQATGSPPPVPAGVAATAGDAQAMLSWSTSSGATGYKVKRATVSGGPYTTVGSPTATRFVDTGATNGTTFFYVVSAINASGESANSTQVSAAPNASTCKTATGGASGVGTWVNTSFPLQSGTFSAEYDGMPSALLDSSIAMSKGAQTAFTGFATLTRFNTTGNIDARNGGAFAASVTLPYSGGNKYHFRLVVNVPTHTYSIFVTAPGGSEQTIGSNFAFRTEQNTVTSLDNWGVNVNKTGTTFTDKVCNFWVHP